MPLSSSTAWDPALRAIQSMEQNLKRERRVFSMVIILLIVGAFVAAIATIAGLLGAALEHEEKATRLAIQSLVDNVQQRNNALTTASLIVELRAGGILPPTTGRRASNHCVASIPMADAQSILLSSCNATVQLLSASGPAPSLELILTDGSAAYEYAFQPQSSGTIRLTSAAEAQELVNAVLDRYRAVGLDPILAARAKTGLSGYAHHMPRKTPYLK